MNTVEPTLITHKGNRVITLDELLDLHNIKKDECEILRYKANVWEVAIKNSENKPEIVQLHQVSAEIKPLRQILEWKDVLIDILDGKIKTKRKHKEIEGDYLGVIPHFDLHIDKYANSGTYLKEVNDKTFDIFNTLRKNGAERLLLINGGDYFNSDGKYKTTKGTEQLNYLTEKEAFKLGLEHQTELINTLAGDMPVDVMYVSGNHDDLKLQALSDAIDIYYSKDARVNIDNEDSFRKYYDWGNTTIGMGHGDGIKEKDILSVFSAEKGLNEHNYYLKGHIHHQLKQLYGNLLVETFGTPSNSGEWDKKMGYITKGKIVGQLYDKSNGKSGEFYK